VVRHRLRHSSSDIHADLRATRVGRKSLCWERRLRRHLPGFVSGNVRVRALAAPSAGLHQLRLVRRDLSHRRVSHVRAGSCLTSPKEKYRILSKEFRIMKEFQAWLSFVIRYSLFDIRYSNPREHYSFRSLSRGHFKAPAATFSADAFSVVAVARFAKDSRSSSPA
jgi:hypothetical protein